VRNAAFDDLTVFERGWLSSNNILLHGRGDGEPATLVDASHCLHAPQTVALVENALRPGETLATLVNTHLHSDHCGGDAALQGHFGARLVIPPGEAGAVASWDEERLSYRATGQRIERYAHAAVLKPDTTFTVGRRAWTALAAPGHDPHSLILFDARNGVLMSADALWGDGFGIVFPELDGEQAFDDVAAVLDLIERLAPRWVIPGHGAPFDDVADALQRARARLSRFAAEPARHARHGAKVLIKYHLLEERSQPLTAFRRWWAETPLARRVWQRLGRPERTLEAWGESLLRELVASGALALDVTGLVHDR
jgi:glyoxylase-like metal-dependent hydrolase (beta-lactamase superfamily II)